MRWAGHLVVPAVLVCAWVPHGAPSLGGAARNPPPIRQSSAHPGGSAASPSAKRCSTYRKYASARLALSPCISARLGAVGAQAGRGFGGATVSNPVAHCRSMQTTRVVGPDDNPACTVPRCEGDAPVAAPTFARPERSWARVGGVRPTARGARRRASSGCSGPRPPRRNAGLARDAASSLAKASRLAARYGVTVVDVASGKVLVEGGSRYPITLASNAKLVTTALALDVFGPAHRWYTELRAPSPRAPACSTGRVETLALVGGGDPGLTFEELDAMAAAVARWGIGAVDRVCYAEAVFSGGPLPPRFDTRDEDGAWRAAVGALVVDSSAIEVHFRPGHKLGAPVVVELVPPTRWVRLDVEARTVRGRRDHLRVHSKSASDGRPVVEVTGSLGIRAHPGFIKRRIDAPARFTTEVFADALRRHGVDVVGAGRPCPRGVEQWHRWLRYSSGSLTELVRRTNLWSNNAMAEMLFHHLGEWYARGADLPGAGPAMCHPSLPRHARGSWDDARRAVECLLRRQGVAPDAFRWANGSGLYDADFMTSRALAQWFAKVLRSKRVGPALAASLPVAGRDGTLKHRMRHGPASGRVHAKTGTLADVVTLTGYVDALSGRRYVFALLFEELKAKRSAVRRWQDAFCALLASH